MKSGNDIKIMHPDRTGKSSTSDSNVNNKSGVKVEDSRSKSTSKVSENESK